MAKIDKTKIEALKAIKNSNLLIKLIQENVKESPETAVSLLDELGDNLEGLGGIDLSALESIQGADGKTPILGEDYMTEEEIDALEDFIKENLDTLGDELGKRLEQAINTSQEQLKTAVATIKNGEDGKDGKDGKDVTQKDIKAVFDEFKSELKDSPLEVVEKLKKVNGSKRLGFKNVRGLPELEKKVVDNTDDIEKMREEMLTEITIASTAGSGGGGAGSDTDAIHDNVAGEIAAVALKGTPTGADFILIEDSADSNNKKRIAVGTLPTAGGGEANTASNVGTGDGDVFKQKNGIDLELKTIKAGSGVTITNNVDDITIDATGGGTGDMTKAVYDPTTVNGDAFDMDNMAESATSKVLTSTERAEIVANTAKVTNATHTGDVTGDTALVIGIDKVKDVHIDWGNGANQVSQDDVVDGATYVRTQNNYTDAEKTKVGHISVTQAVDLDTIESDTATNNAKVTNATHTGEVTGSGALTLDATAISNKTSDVSLVGTEEILMNDGGLKKTTAQAIANLAAASTGDMTKAVYDASAIEEQLLGETATQTITNKRITTRVSTITSSATPTPNGDTTDEYTITALAVNATIGAPTGTPTNGQKLVIRIDDNGTARTLAWNAIYNEISSTLPTTTVVGETIYVGFIYNTGTSKWDAFVADAGNNPVFETVAFTSELDNGSKTASASIDFATNQKQKVTLTANTITLTLDTTNLGVGNYLLKIVNGGLATLTWAVEGGAIYFPGGTDPTLTSSGTDIVSFYFDGTNAYAVASLDFS